MRTMNIRRADSRDLPTLSQLYRDSVRALGPEAYSAEQIAAWSAFADADSFSLFITDAATFVAEDETGILGFCGIEADGHVTSVYVRADSFRQGIAGRLLSHVISYANDLEIPRLHTETSHFSRQLFHHHGFVDCGMETIERHQVTFERFLVERITTDHR